MACILDCLGATRISSSSWDRPSLLAHTYLLIVINLAAVITIDLLLQNVLQGTFVTLGKNSWVFLWSCTAAKPLQLPRLPRKCARGPYLGELTILISAGNGQKKADKQSPWKAFCCSNTCLKSILHHQAGCVDLSTLWKMYSAISHALAL